MFETPTLAPWARDALRPRRPMRERFDDAGRFVVAVVVFVVMSPLYVLIPGARLIRRRRQDDDV